MEGLISGWKINNVLSQEIINIQPPAYKAESSRVKTFVGMTDRNAIRVL